jgi:fluoride ion exporter CrcB/FEX
MHKVEQYAWMLVLPALAECVASVWVPDLNLRSHDMKLIFLNVTGALLEGLLAAWEDGRAKPPRGSVGKALTALAGPIRGSFIAAYTSWGGMVSFAAGQGESLLGCLAYLAVTATLGLLAYNFGGLVAATIQHAPSSGKAAKPIAEGSVRTAILVGVVAFIVSTEAAVKLGLQDYEDESGADADSMGPALIKFLDAEWARLFVGMACAVAGALVGNTFAGVVESRIGSGEAVARGTLSCNFVFCLLSLCLPAAALRRARWGRSVILQSFAGSFCGAATDFGGWMNETSSRWREGKGKAAAANLAANLLVAVTLLCVFVHVDLLNARVSTIDTNGNKVTEVAELIAYYSR